MSIPKASYIQPSNYAKLNNAPKLSILEQAPTSIQVEFQCKSHNTHKKVRRKIRKDRHTDRIAPLAYEIQNPNVQAKEQMESCSGLALGPIEKTKKQEEIKKSKERRLNEN